MTVLDGRLGRLVADQRLLIDPGAVAFDVQDPVQKQILEFVYEFQWDELNDCVFHVGRIRTRKQQQLRLVSICLGCKVQPLYSNKQGI